MSSVSVVVATRDRSALLPRLVAALDAQDYEGDLEVVVVDDGSRDDTRRVLVGLAVDAQVAVRVEATARSRGPAAARNIGWRAARGEVIAFTDDDCAPRPGWVSALATALADADLVQGATVPAHDEPAGPFAHTLRIEAFSGRFETCNVGYRRELLEDLGGFDESFRYPYGEDIDLGWRAVERGARVAFAPEAIVEHAVLPSSFARRVRSSVRQEGIVRAVARHPGLRSSLSGRLWSKPIHPHALGVAAGAVVALGARSPAGRLAGVALALPFVNYRTRVEQLPCRKWQWPYALPLDALAHVVDIAVLARASARHRTLVL